MTDLTEDEREKVRDLLESWDNVRVGIHVLSVVGNVVKWVSGVAIAAVLLWTVVHTGKAP